MERNDRFRIWFSRSETAPAICCATATKHTGQQSFHSERFVMKNARPPQLRRLLGVTYWSYPKVFPLKSQLSSGLPMIARGSCLHTLLFCGVIRIGRSLKHSLSWD